MTDALFDTTAEPVITVTAIGTPAPQGSKRHVGNGVMVESSKKVKPWRQDVKYAALTVLSERPDWTPLDGPLRVRMVFTFTRPKSHYRTGRNAHLLRDGAPSRPAGYPDSSKIARSTEDALTEAGVWVDDSRVVTLEVEKRYAQDPAGGLDVLAVPGAVIHVWRLP